MTVGDQDELRDRPAADQVLLNDALKHLGRAGVIPDALGIDHGNRTLRADPETVGLGAENKRFRAAEIQLVQSSLQKIPGFQSRLVNAALRLGLVGAQKDVTLVMFQPQGLHGGLRGVGHDGYWFLAR